MAGLRLTLLVPAAEERGHAVRKVWIETEEVVMVYQNLELETIVRLRGGLEFAVREDFDKVALDVWVKKSTREEREHGLAEWRRDR